MAERQVIYRLVRRLLEAELSSLSDQTFRPNYFRSAGAGSIDAETDVMALLVSPSAAPLVPWSAVWFSRAPSALEACTIKVDNGATVEMNLLAYVTEGTVTYGNSVSFDNGLTSLPNAWISNVVTFDPSLPDGAVKLYTDGTLTATSSGDDFNWSGAGSAIQYLDASTGDIHNPAWFSRVLSANEARSIANAGFGCDLLLSFGDYLGGETNGPRHYHPGPMSADGTLADLGFAAVGCAMVASGDVVCRNIADDVDEANTAATLDDWQFFGGGSDGDHTVTTTTYTGGPFVNGVLVRDSDINTLVITATGSVDTGPFSLFALAGDLSDAVTGAIKSTGNNAALTVAGAQKSGISVGLGSAGTAGQAGGTAAGQAGAGSGSQTFNGGAGGIGGVGGAGASGIGGNGGTYSGSTTISPCARPVVTRRGSNSGMGGSGGGSGGGDGTAGGNSGGGGSGSPGMIVCIKTLITSGSTSAGAIQSQGGNGADGVAAAAGNRGGGAGGGGGGGGDIVVICRERVGPTVPNLIQSVGGAGGTGGAGFGTGGAGADGRGGASGRIDAFVLSTGAHSAVATVASVTRPGGSGVLGF